MSGLDVAQTFALQTIAKYIAKLKKRVKEKASAPGAPARRGWAAAASRMAGATAAGAATSIDPRHAGALRLRRREMLPVCRGFARERGGEVPVQGGMIPTGLPELSEFVQDRGKPAKTYASEL